jgi:hypothetical protein
MKRAGRDDTEIGSILIAMGVCTSRQVEIAAKKYKEDALDKRLGTYLVAQGHVSRQQLDMAVNAQAGLRSKKRHRRAMAQADIAESSSVANLSLARNLRKRAAAVRSTTGQDHAAITPKMVAGSKE